MYIFLRVKLLLLGFLLINSSVFAHEHTNETDVSEHKPSVEKITDEFYLVQAGGGNILLFVGSEGTFMVDNGLSDRKDDVLTAISTVTDQPIKMLVNTHWHFDHSGNNQQLKQNGTLLLAHENVRKRLAVGQVIPALEKEITAAPKEALPALTYDDGVTLYMNEDTIKIIKMTESHTDGDSIVLWQGADVLHTGDIFFNGMFPFIDSSSGGNLSGMITATDEILLMVTPQTKIIPGHGALANRAELEAYNMMLKDVAARLDAARSKGQTKQDWIKSDPLVDLTDKWGGGFLNVEKFTDIIWDASSSMVPYK